MGSRTDYVLQIDNGNGWRDVAIIKDRAEVMQYYNAMKGVSTFHVRVMGRVTSERRFVEVA